MTVVSKRIRAGLYAIGTPEKQFHLEDVTTLARDYGDVTAPLVTRWRLTDVTGDSYDWVGDFDTKREAMAYVQN